MHRRSSDVARERRPIRPGRGTKAGARNDLSADDATPTRGPSRGRGLRALLASLATRRITHPFTVGIAVYGAVYEVARRLPDSAQARTFFGGAGLLPISLLVFALAVALRTHARSRSRDVAGLAPIGLATLAMFLADAGRFAVESFPDAGVSHLWTDLPHAAAVLLLVAGLLRLAGGLGRGVERLCLVLDVLTVMTTAIVLSAHYVVQPQVAAGLTGPCTVLCPIGDLATLFAVAVLVLRRPADVPRGVVVALATAVFARCVGNGAHAALDASDVFRSLGLADTARLVEITAFAAALESRSPVAPPVEGGALREQRMRLHPLPYVAAGLAYVALVAECWAGRRLAPWDLAVGSAAVTIAVIARQVLAVRENAGLWRERATLLGEARLSALVRHATDAVWILDADGRVTWASASSRRVVGRDPEELVGRTFLDSFTASDRDWARSLLGQALASPREPVTASGRMPVPDRAEPACIELTFTSLLDEPHVDGIVANLHDVTARARLESELSHRAFHDGLTGLANRSLFQDRVEHALARCLRSGRTMAVCLVDLDHFKTVNDSIGHDQGDRLLVSAAQRLGRCLRAGDTPARLGGDEFGVLLEGITDVEQVHAVCDRITAALRAPFALSEREATISASIGVALAVDGDDAEVVLRNADVAMYHAKEAGRGRYRVFEPSMHAVALARLDLREALGHAIARDELTVCYQPLVDLATRETRGVEALCRWTREGGESISPSIFIPIAEQTGQIVAVGRFVLERACRDARSWISRMPAGRPFSVTVNLSVRQLQDETLVDDVRRVLAQTGLPASSLVLELTESVLAEDADAILAALSSLKALGVRLAIDDFGTGYSSLAYLRRFPIDILKVAKSFVDDIREDGEGEALAKTILSMAANLSLDTVAEGIETPIQAEKLQSLGCRLGQGYLFAPALPEGELAKRLGLPEPVAVPVRVERF